MGMECVLDPARWLVPRLAACRCSSRHCPPSRPLCELGSGPSALGRRPQKVAIHWCLVRSAGALYFDTGRCSMVKVCATCRKAHPESNIHRHSECSASAVLFLTHQTTRFYHTECQVLVAPSHFATPDDKILPRPKSGAWKALTLCRIREWESKRVVTALPQCSVPVSLLVSW